MLNIFNHSSLLNVFFATYWMKTLMAQQKQISKQSWLFFLLLTIIWGSSFILIKKSLIAFTPIQSGAFRIFISTLALIPVTISTYKNIHKKNILPILGVGLFGSGIPPFLFAFGQSKIDSAMAGMLNTLTPIAAFLLGLLFFGLQFRWFKLLGVLIGFAGATIIIVANNNGAIGGANIYGLFIIAASVCYGTSVNIISRYLKDTSPATITAWSFTLVCLFPIIALTIQNPIPVFQTHPQAISSFLALLALAIFGTVIANTMFYKMTQQTNPIFASSITYTLPIVALFWGVFDGEPFYAWYILGMLLILVGVFITSKKKLTLKC